jgi:hypothetical protein
MRNAAKSYPKLMTSLDNNNSLNTDSWALKVLAHTVTCVGHPQVLVMRLVLPSTATALSIARSYDSIINFPEFSLARSLPIIAIEARI